MKKLINFIAIITLALTCTLSTCTHIHDDKCGFKTETGEECTHECELIDPHYGFKDPND